VRDLTGSGEVTKRRIKEGVGEFPIDCPLEDNAVRVHFKATIADTDQVVPTSQIDMVLPPIHVVKPRPHQERG